MLVTGGAGYIGSHAAKALHGAGYRVVVYDNFSAGHRGAVKYGELVEGDIADVAAVRAALRRHEVSGVMHFAAVLDVGESVREPIRYYRNNVVGALSVLEAMAAESVRQFVFSSTCATYGEPIETPITETHPQRPINSYGETKLAVEHALPHVETAHGIHWVALRYFNAAGADPDGEIGEDHSPEIHLIPRAIEAATGGRGLQVFGDDYPTPDGTCLRDYVHVTDLADAHVRALEAIVETGKSGAYNLGTGRPHSVHLGETPAGYPHATHLPRNLRTKHLTMNGIASTAANRSVFSANPGHIGRNGSMRWRNNRLALTKRLGIGIAHFHRDGSGVGERDASCSH